MLLRLIDRYSEKKGTGGIEIKLEDINCSDQFSTDSYESPFSIAFCKTLAWYYRDYPLLPAEQPDDKGVVEKTIKFGQYLGDQLLGEDHELYRLKDNIEETGYEFLEVRVESSRIEFFDDIWEALILPESKYVLSSTVKGFVRHVTDSGADPDWRELEYRLKVTPPIANTIAGLNQEGSDQVASVDRSGDEPLNIMHVIYRPPYEDGGRPSNALNTSFEMFAAEGAINYDIFPIETWGELVEKLCSQSNRVHILHIDSPLFFKEGSTCLGAVTHNAPGSNLPVTELIQAMASANVPVLCLDSYLDISDEAISNQDLNLRQCLATIAGTAEHFGVGNVVGLSENADPWTSSACFRNLYLNIARGFSVTQAVVETRKAFQSQVEISTFTSNPLPFHYWSLLQHYGGQPVVFFEAPQVVSSLADSQTLLEVRRLLHGFKLNFLSLPSCNVSDGQILDLIRVSNLGNHGLHLQGAVGQGKTHTVHHFALYLAQSRKIDYGFYFDCSSEFYSTEIVLEMVAPILEEQPEDKDAIRKALTRHSCLFVFDNLTAADNLVHDSWREIESFLVELSKEGHYVVVTGNVRSEDSAKTLEKTLLSDFTSIELAPLPPLEQKVLGANVLRQNDLTGKDRENWWGDFIDTLQGNPFLLTQVIPQLASSNPDALTDQINEYIAAPLSCNGDTVGAFYRWQWSSLTKPQQQLLLLGSTVDGLLIEMLMIACDQETPFEPGQLLLKSLGADAETKVAKILDRWEQAGFTTRLPHGRIINSRAETLLREMRDSSEYDLLKDKSIELLFSKVLCEGIRLLSSHVVNQQDPTLIHVLLMNRRHWVEHFERLWFAGDFHGFMAVKNAFEQLMKQAKLNAEMATWASDLLSRSSDVSIADDTPVESKLSWLSMAILAIDNPESNAEIKITAGAELWQIWMDNLEDHVNNDQVALAHQVFMFLENYYFRVENYEKIIPLARKAQLIYKNRDAWHWVIHALKALAKANLQLDCVNKALEYEQQIIDDIPYDQSPPGFQAQQMVELVAARLGRGDTGNAQVLLDDIKGRDDVNPVKGMLEGLQAEIHLQEKQYFKAAPYYCDLWIKALKSEQRHQLEQLKKLLTEIEQQVGEQEFEKLFLEMADEETDHDVIHPRDFTL